MKSVYLMMGVTLVTIFVCAIIAKTFHLSDEQMRHLVTGGAIVIITGCIASWRVSPK